MGLYDPVGDLAVGGVGGGFPGSLNDARGLFWRLIYGNNDASVQVLLENPVRGGAFDIRDGSGFDAFNCLQPAVDLLNRDAPQYPVADHLA